MFKKLLLQRLFAVCFLLAFLASACGDDADTSDNSASTSGNSTGTADTGPILVLGDSIMAWNVEENASIGHVLEQRTGRAVTIHAESGAFFASVDDGEDIRSQYEEGDWSWVVFDGGGNDLNDRCQCLECSGVLNELISADGMSGAIPEAVAVIRESGAKVLFLTYYGMPTTAQFGFAECNDESSVLAQRGAAMAQALDGVFWGDMSTVMGPEDLSDYVDDHVHPSASGSAAVGSLAADIVSAN